MSEVGNTPGDGRFAKTYHGLEVAAAEPFDRTGKGNVGTQRLAQSVACGTLGPACIRLEKRVTERSRTATDAARERQCVLRSEGLQKCSGSVGLLRHPDSRPRL